MVCNGIFPLFAMKHGLVPEGIQLVYPANRRETPIYLAGKYTIRSLSHSIEAQTECQSTIHGKIITLEFPHDKKFTLIEPNIFDTSAPAATMAPGTSTGSIGGVSTPASPSINAGAGNSIPGDTISQINGYAIIQGPLSNLTITRRILSKLLKPPKEIRLEAILINDNLSRNIDLSISPGTTPIDLSNLNALWTGTTATINVLRQIGAIVTAYQTILTPGETETYTDTDQRVLNQFTTTGQTSGAGLLQSGLLTRSAGLTITVTANPGPGYWIIDGSIGNSTFEGSSALADELANDISWTSTIYPGEMERVTQVTTTNTTHGIGVETNSPSYNDDKTDTTFSLWIRLQTLKPGIIEYIGTHKIKEKK
ncbi:MAG: hypothetical protein M0Z50_15550 [Planctomycetia bacterium]|nr:hypothetical protein [Planctomycetia bacterium]